MKMKPAAVGFRVHSGWTALVAFCVEKGSPCVLIRQRPHLVETFTYGFRQPYHTAEKMPLSEARQFILRVDAEAKRLAVRAIRGLQSELQKLDIELASCGLLVASGRPLPALEKILGSHSLIHTADGELFREAILHACGRCKLQAERIKEKELLERGQSALRTPPAALMRRVTELGKPLGPPWSQDEKYATLAAWLAFEGRQNERNVF